MIHSASALVGWFFTLKGLNELGIYEAQWQRTLMIAMKHLNTVATFCNPFKL